MLEVNIEYDGEASNTLTDNHHRETVRTQTDCMEPEDATFYRDLAWIKDAILEAYELGKEDQLLSK